MNKTILFITPNFAPLGGIGVQRPIAFAKYLKKSGYNPIVFTVSQEDMRRTRGISDNNRLKEIQNLGIEIEYVPTGKNYNKIQRMMKLRLFRLLWIFRYDKYWDEYAVWPKNAKRRAIEIIEEYNIKLIYTCSGPFSALELAKSIKLETGVNWISDVRDPLTEHFSLKWPTKMHWKWLKRKEGKLFPFADHTIVVTDEMKTIFQERYEMNESNLTVITNGF